uniref:Uncharacterized protein n=1 Tax=Anopheles farauti TaxID=69004 RepID=A0A182Q632_9DIPT
MAIQLRSESRVSRAGRVSVYKTSRCTGGANELCSQPSTSTVHASSQNFAHSPAREMKTLIVFALLAVVAVAANQNAKTLRYENVQDGDASYKFAFESDDGISRQEQGELKTEEEGMNVQGNFKFVADDGQEYEVQYVADSQGFHPEGAHIPKEYVDKVPSL